MIQKRNTKIKCHALAYAFILFIYYIFPFLINHSQSYTNTGIIFELTFNKIFNLNVVNGEAFSSSGEELANNKTFVIVRGNKRALNMPIEGQKSNKKNP